MAYKFSIKLKRESPIKRDQLYNLIGSQACIKDSRTSIKYNSSSPKLPDKILCRVQPAHYSKRHYTIEYELFGLRGTKNYNATTKHNTKE